MINELTRDAFALSASKSSLILGYSVPTENATPSVRKIRIRLATMITHPQPPSGGPFTVWSDDTTDVAVPFAVLFADPFADL